MVHFPQKRLQVFVSSTFLDLKEERQAAVEAILEAGHIPAGMELFTAGDESQMEVIKQWIDQSDVYLLILGGRYGSIDNKSGKSYIHLEYDYAFEREIPVFACVLKDPKKRAEDKADFDLIESRNSTQYDDFRNVVQSRMVEFWEDTKDIKYTITRKLQEFTRRDDLIGWVKGDQQIVSASITEEMARLSKENGDLRSQLNEKENVTYAGLSYKQLRDILLNSELSEEDIEIINKTAEEIAKGSTFEPQFHSINWNCKINQNLLVFLLFFSKFDVEKTHRFSYFSSVTKLHSFGLLEKIKEPGQTTRRTTFRVKLTSQGCSFLNKVIYLRDVEFELNDGYQDFDFFAL
jgi:hypothetical protein